MIIYDESIQEYEEDATSWIALSDMMTGLMAIFLALAIAILAMQQGKRDAIVLSVSQTIEQSLKEKGIDVNVDKKTGRLILSSDTNFEFGQATLSQKGKNDLDVVIPVYAEAIFGKLDAEQLKSIERIVVEGHTDKVGGYAQNMTLSTQRANAILSYIDAMPVFSYKPDLLQKLTAVGRGENDAMGVDETQNLADRKVIIRIEFFDYHKIDDVSSNIKQGLNVS